VLLHFTFLGKNAVSSEPTLFKFCYEDKEVLPHYSGGTPYVPNDNPGAAIEVLRQLDSLIPSIKIEFIRLPWKRCLKELEIGIVHSVIGSYSHTRSSFASFPAVGKSIDNDKAFLKMSVCLLHQKSISIIWDGIRFEFSSLSPIVMTVPRGYQSIEIMKKYGFKIYETNSINKAHELLFMNRVSASVGLCNYNELPKNITQNPLPIQSQYGYLMINNEFYNMYPGQSEYIWETLKNIDLNKYYDKYE